MFHYVYRITNIEQRIYYYGKRSRLVQTSIPVNTFSPELVEIISKQYPEL